MFTTKRLFMAAVVVLGLCAGLFYTINPQSSVRPAGPSAIALTSIETPPINPSEPPPAEDAAEPPNTLGTVLETITRRWNEIHSLRAAVQTYSTTTPASPTGVGALQNGSGSYEYRKQDSVGQFRVELTLRTEVTGQSTTSDTEHQSQNASFLHMLKVFDGTTVYQEMTTLDPNTMQAATGTIPTVIKGNSGDFTSFLSPGGVGEHPLALLRKYGLDLQVNPETTVEGRKVYVLEAAPQGGPPADAPVARMIFFFDQETGAILRVEYWSGQNMLTASTDLRNVMVNQDPAGDRLAYSPPSNVEVRELGEMSGLSSESTGEKTSPPLPAPPQRRTRDLRVR